MAEEALFCGSEGRSLAFSRAASVLKSLPWTVRSAKDLNSLPGIGEHSRKIIQVIVFPRLLVHSQPTLPPISYSFSASQEKFRIFRSSQLLEGVKPAAMCSHKDMCQFESRPPSDLNSNPP